MFILDIYTHYQIPPNLQRHQMEVAGVCQKVLDQWSGAEIDRDLTITTALLHDMGNIIKFKRPFLEELEDAAEHWENVQNNFITKYGPDVKTATALIVQELQLPQVSHVLEQMERLIHHGTTTSWEARVVELGDMHVSPQGVVTFEERLADLIKRYNYVGSEPWIAAMRENYRLVEKQVNCQIKEIDLRTKKNNFEQISIN